MKRQFEEETKDSRFGTHEIGTQSLCLSLSLYYTEIVSVETLMGRAHCCVELNNLLIENNAHT